MDRLFFVAPDAISYSATYVHPEGWRLVASSRTSGEQFQASDRETYNALSTAELIDVILADLSTRLRIS